MVMTCFPFVCGKKASSSFDPTVDFDGGAENIHFYTYKELRSATDTFNQSNKIGEGGFGPVYKGKLKDGTLVAIKVLSPESRQGVQEFLTELTVLADIVHENLVEMLGCCVEGNSRILVTRYQENNSLAQTLLGQNRNAFNFTWAIRRHMCIGIARGLAFLHEEVEPHIIHRDIKASNILLDKDLTAKLADFGLAKLIPANMTHVSTKVAGTLGYLAPEYALRGQLTRKADIYSFGVLLMEIICGRCNKNRRLPPGEQYLLQRRIALEKLAVSGSGTIARDLVGLLQMKMIDRASYNGCVPGFLSTVKASGTEFTSMLVKLVAWVMLEKEALVELVDEAFREDLDIEEAERFLKVGLLCSQQMPNLRPAMSSVVKMLQGEEDVSVMRITPPGILPEVVDEKIKENPEQKETKNSSPIFTPASGSSSLQSEQTTYPTLTFTSISARSN